MEPYALIMLRVLALCLALVLTHTATAAAPQGKVRLDFDPGAEELARGGPTGVDVIAKIDRGWHIQAHRPNEPFLIPTELIVVVPPGVTTEEVGYPPPDEAEFAFAAGKKLLVYEGNVGMATALHVPADFPGKRVRLEAKLRYQACNDESCLPPMTATAELILPVAVGVSLPPGTAAGRGAGTDIGRWFDEYGIVVTFALVMLLGLGLNLTPCVYPLVSVTVSFFGGQARGTPRRVLGLALLYVAGIALTFSALGVAASLSGGLFGAILQKPAVLVGIAALLVVLALSSFGLYQIRPPPLLLRLAGGAAQGAFGAFFMGLTMGIVAAPCVGPIVLGLLVFVGSRQDPVLGLALFMALSLGLGAPYVVLAVAAGSLGKLPRSGEWLVWVEHFFGFVLLGLALYFVAPLLPGTLSALALPVLAGAAAVYLGFVDPAGAGIRHVKRAVGVVGVVLAIWMGIPAPVQTPIEWQPYSEAALASARAAGRPAVVDFAAEWCLPCKEMDHTTFVDSEVRRVAGDFHMIKVDLTEENEENDRISEQFDVRGVPTTIFFDPAGAEVERMVGFVDRDEMLRAMRVARNGAAPRERDESEMGT